MDAITPGRAKKYAPASPGHDREQQDDQSPHPEPENVVGFLYPGQAA